MYEILLGELKLLSTVFVIYNQNKTYFDFFYEKISFYPHYFHFFTSLLCLFLAIPDFIEEVDWL